MKKLLAQSRNILILLLTVSLLAISCNNDCHNRKVHKVQYKECCVRHHDNGVETLLWYYILTNPRGGYYYYSSPTQVTNFNTVVWQETTVNPVAEQEIVSETESTLNQEDANFTEEMQSELPSEEAVADLPSEEGNSETPSESSESGSGYESESSTDSDSGSGDSGGSSDSGGGDSGGGDSGGGE